MFSITYFGWVLFLHLLSAFALVGGLTLFVVAQVAARRTQLPAVAVALGRIVAVGTTGVRAGLIGTVVFGVWLVPHRERLVDPGWLGSSPRSRSGS